MAVMDLATPQRSPESGMPAVPLCLSPSPVSLYECPGAALLSASTGRLEQQKSIPPSSEEQKSEIMESTGLRSL